MPLMAQDPRHRWQQRKVLFVKESQIVARDESPPARKMIRKLRRKTAAADALCFAASRTCLLQTDGYGGFARRRANCNADGMFISESAMFDPSLIGHLPSGTSMSDLSPEAQVGHNAADTPHRIGGRTVTAAPAGRLIAYVIEDAAPLGVLYQEYLRKLGFVSRWFGNGRDGLQAIADQAPDLLLVDLQLPDINGDKILEQLQAEKVTFPRVVITAHGSVTAAVDAMRLGAVDFLEKPFSIERLKVTVSNVIEHARLRHEVRVIREQIERREYAGFVGSSLPMQVVYRIIDSAATSRATVFITGESGTGKELCAQAIHERSDRADKTFVAINCGAIPRELFESEIFGHVKGAFSGATSDRQGAAERADGGTLFLDEIGEMDLDQQVKLLRFIQTGVIQRVGSNKPIKLNVRFVCATNRDPLEQVAAGRFREDLYYRLNVIPIRMPALRERGEDVVEIARHFLQAISAEEGRSFEGFSAEVEQRLRTYDWPGNVRQLHNVVHNVVLLNAGSVVTPEMLPRLEDSSATLRVEEAPALRMTHGPAALTAPVGQDTDQRRIEPLWRIEQQAIRQAIDLCDGNIPVAAAHLGVSASTIYRKIKAWEDSAAAAAGAGA